MTNEILIIPGCTQIITISYHHSKKIFDCSIKSQILKHLRIHLNQLISIPKASANPESKYLIVINLIIL